MPIDDALLILHGNCEMELNKARLGIAVLALCVSLETRGALFSARDWKLDYDVGAGGGYDSNLTYSNNGPSSSYYQAQTNFKASRQGGRSTADFAAGLSATVFGNDAVEDQVDGNAMLRYEYAKNEVNRPAASAEFRFTNSRTPNSSVGQRVVVQDLRGGAVVDVANSGVGILSVGADASRRHYVGRQFDTNSRLAVNGVMTFNPTSLLRYSSTLYVGGAESKPNDSQRLKQSNRFVGLTGRADGQLTAAIRGTLFAGGQYVELRSGMDDKRLVPVAGGIVTWNPSVNQAVRASIDMGESFNADGSWSEFQRIRLAFEQRFYRSWVATVQVVPSTSKYVRTTSTRNDDEVGFGASVGYIPSERLQVLASFDYSTQDSNEVRYDFDRRNFYLSAVFRW